MFGKMIRIGTAGTGQGPAHPAKAIHLLVTVTETDRLTKYHNSDCKDLENP